MLSMPVPASEEELHNRIWEFIRSTAADDCVICRASRLIDEDEEAFESLVVQYVGTGSGECINEAAQSLLQIRSRFDSGSTYIPYPKRRWLTLAGLERRTWQFIELWSLYEQHSIAIVGRDGEEEHCSVCDCKISASQPHHESCPISVAGQLMEIRNLFPEDLELTRETVQRPKMLPRDPSGPTARKTNWKRHRSPGRATSAFIREYLVPGRTDIPNLSLAFIPRLPTGGAPISLSRVDLQDDNDVETWFCRCNVTIPQPLPLGPFPVKTEIGILYPSQPGSYNTVLWREQVQDCLMAGCYVTVQGGWGWSKWTQYNADWNVLCEELQGRVEVPGEISMPGNEGTRMYNLSLRAEADPTHSWMIHWFAYAIMWLSREQYREALAARSF